MPSRFLKGGFSKVVGASHFVQEFFPLRYRVLKDLIFDHKEVQFHDSIFHFDCPDEIGRLDEIPKL